MGNDEKEPAKIIYVPSFSEPASAAADEIDLREVWRCLGRGRWFIAGFTIACTLAATLVVFLVLPVTYKSGAVLIPAQSPEDATSQVAGLVGQLGIPLGLASGKKSNSIMAFLGSRNLQEKLLSKYELLPRLYPRLWDASKKAWRVTDPADTPTVVKAIQENDLAEIYGVGQDKGTELITLSWVDQDPAFSALMLEKIIQELQNYLENEYETDAQHEREFVERQLSKATAELEHWEQQVPSQSLPLTKILRERLAAQTVYTELRRQLEMAKITEAKELVRFKVLDAPLVPEKKFKPNRALIIALTALLSAGLAAVAVLGHHFFRPRNAVAAP
ncbi:MAG: hypothetical protein HGA96_00745 [Desulfobulbaceae bacterium]|nr:hypothetical protein [Desulfobulbaceae bacterium]